MGKPHPSREVLHDVACFYMSLLVPDTWGPFFGCSNFTFYTLHSTLYTPHSTLYTLHSTFHTPHFTLYTPHFTLFALLSALHTLHFTLSTPHLTLYTPHSTIPTSLYTLHSLLNTPLSSRPTLFTPPSAFHSLQCTGLVAGEKCTSLFKQLVSQKCSTWLHSGSWAASCFLLDDPKQAFCIRLRIQDIAFVCFCLYLETYASEISVGWYMGMDQNLLIPFLVGWTSIYQLFWGSLGARVLTNSHMFFSTSN